MLISFARRKNQSEKTKAKSLWFLLHDASKVPEIQCWLIDKSISATTIAAAPIIVIQKCDSVILYNIFDWIFSVLTQMHTAVVFISMFFSSVFLFIDLEKYDIKRYKK